MAKRLKFIDTLLQTLRIEELLGLMLIVFAIVFATYANLQFVMDQSLDSRDITLNFLRIVASALFAISFNRLILLHSENRIIRIARDFAPFLFVLVIYFNLQDAIFILNPTDIHYTLLKLDGKLFGLQPTVWAEQLYHPRITDLLSLSYLNYYFMTPILLAILYLKGKTESFRVIMLTIMISYFIGFVCYLLFPASSPYLVIPELYTVDIWQDTSFFSWLTYTIVDMSPHRVRDAFPSMHNAIVLLSIILAYRYHRPYFWIQLPLAAALPFATVYLRYHYVVDIIGAIPVVALALYLSPRLEMRWTQFQINYASPGDELGGNGVNY